jgi:hypothetical protein
LTLQVVLFEIFFISCFTKAALHCSI